MRRLCVLCLAAGFVAGCTGGAATVAPDISAGSTASLIPLPAPTVTHPATTEASPTPEPTLTPSPTLVPTAGPTPLAGASRIAFSIIQKTFEGYQSLGVYMLEIASGEMGLVSDPGLIVHGVSPYGGRMLVSMGQALYVMGLDGSNPILLTEGYCQPSEHGAYWHQKLDRVVYLATDGTEYGVYLINADGSEARRITPPGVNAVELYPSMDEARVYWASGVCYPSGDCALGDLLLSSIDGSGSEILPAGIRRPAGSPQGDWYAYEWTSGEGRVGFYLAEIEGAESWRVEAGGDHFLDYAWSPDGGTIALIAADRSGYSGRIQAHRYFLVSSRDGQLQALASRLGANSIVRWSPDGHHLVLAGTELDGEGYILAVRVVDLQAGQVTRHDLSEGFDRSVFSFIPQISWVP